MTAVVIQGDARRLPLPDASVDLIVTSPPYFGLRSYTDTCRICLDIRHDGLDPAEVLPGYDEHVRTRHHYDGQIGSEATPGGWVAALVACTAEWMRVLKPSGSMFVNLGDKYAVVPQAWRTETDSRSWAHANEPRRLVTTEGQGNIRPKSLLGLPWRYALACTDQLGLILRRDIIWAKPNGLPESVTDRCRSSHEYLFHLVKQPRYYAAVDEIREATHRPGLTWEQRKANGEASRQGEQRNFRDGPGFAPNPLGKLPGSVWNIPSQPLQVPASLGVDHFAAFPMELPRRCVLGWSPPGICVACGEGRRPVVDKALVGVWHDKPPQNSHHLGTRDQHGHRAYGVKETFGSTAATITGYACACTPYTDHPGTGGSSQQDVSRQDGHDRQGVKIRDVSPNNRPGLVELHDYQRVGPRREYHFDGWTPPPTRPAIVLDPFGGTGTTALVATVHGRHGISIDRSADYTRLAQWRTTDPGERARALQVPKPPPVMDGQDALFAL